jgi:hypothetical protein
VKRNTEKDRAKEENWTSGNHGSHHLCSFSGIHAFAGDSD